MPKRFTPPTTLIKISNALNSVQPPSNTGRSTLSTTVDTPAQIARSKTARPQCPVKPSQSEAGTKIKPEPTTGTREKNAITTPQKTGAGNPTRAKPKPPRAP